MPNPTSSRIPLILVLSTTADFYTSRLELSLPFCIAPISMASSYVCAQRSLKRDMLIQVISKQRRKINYEISKWAHVYKLIVILIVTCSVALVVNLYKSVPTLVVILLD
jgi:hypothetical protein